MKGNKKIGAMLILAAFLMGAGCKPQQENPGATPGPQQPKPNPKPSTPAVVQETMHFEGYIEKDIEDAKKVPYFVTVSLSHNKVGATAETVESGILYIGKSDYDAENGTIDVSLADARGVEEAITLTATYEKASKVLIISEFDGMDRKAILTRVTKPGEGKIKRYNTMVNLGDPIGEAFLSLIVKDQHVTAILVAGRIAENGTTGRARTYNATGYVRRGKVFVEIPLDTNRTHVVEVNGTFSGGAVHGVTASLIGSALKTHEEHLDHNAKYADLPLFKPVTFTINSKPRVIDGNGPHGNNTNKKAYLTLRAVPIVKALGTMDVQEPGKNTSGYKTFGYRMYAQFTGFDGTPSKLAHKDVYCKNTLTGEDFANQAASDAATGGNGAANIYKVNEKEYTFDFAAGAFGNGAKFDATTFKIAGWRPEKVSATLPETVTTGEYELTFGGATTFPVIADITTTYGSLAENIGSTATDGYVYLQLNAARKAREAFVEKFELVYANRPSGY